MLLLIDIPEKKYNLIQAMDWKNIENLVRTDEVYKAIHNGKIIPDDCEILTKEAYADLCREAAGLESEENNE